MPNDIQAEDPRSCKSNPIISPYCLHIVSFIMLRYAQKHNYPAQRNALTWWEDKIPSRIDLGKCKYGGPFTVDEEVET